MTEASGHSCEATTHEEGGNAFGGDVVLTSDTGVKTPISAGFFRIEKGKPCVFTYEFDEAKFFAEGECVVQDETGSTVAARAGDVMLFVKGSTMSFSTETYALAFFCNKGRSCEYLGRLRTGKAVRPMFS